MEDVHTEIYKITGAATYIGECCNIIMVTHNTEVFSIFDTSVKGYFANVLQDYKMAAVREIQDALFFFIQFVSNCGVTEPIVLLALNNAFTDIALWSDDDMYDLRQNCLYGVSVIGKILSPEAFKTMVAKSLQAVEKVLTNPNAYTEEALGATENTYIALGTLSLLHTKEAAHVTQFLKQIPLKGEEEAQEAHNFFLDQVLAGNSALVSMKEET